MMLADARLPTGGHTQSAGLEPAVRAGLGADGTRLGDVAAYAADRLRTVTRVEAATAVVARYCVLSAASVEVAGRQLAAVEAGWAARTPSQALRAASRRQGRAYWRLAARLWPDVGELLAGMKVARATPGEAPLAAVDAGAQVVRAAPAAVTADREVGRGVVVGVVGAVAGLSAGQTARLVGYEDAQTVVAASLKLLPVDPAEAAKWLLGLHPDIEEMVAEVKGMTAHAEIPAYGAPLVDLFGQAHAVERMRLFHA